MQVAHFDYCTLQFLALRFIIRLFLYQIGTTPSQIVLQPIALPDEALISQEQNNEREKCTNRACHPLCPIADGLKMVIQITEAFTTKR